MSIRSNVDATEFDQRVRFDRKVESRDNDGGIKHTWAPLGTFHARVDGAKASGAEPSGGDGIRSVSDYTVWIRSDVFTRLNLTVLDRVFWNGQPFNIADIPNQQLRGRKIALIVRTGENDG